MAVKKRPQKGDTTFVQSKTKDRLCLVYVMDWVCVGSYKKSKDAAEAAAKEEAETNNGKYLGENKL